MLLTGNFHDWELSVSSDHPELITPFDELPAHLVANAMRVLLEFGQPSRDLAGEHEVLSFIRGPELNNTVGGVPTSSHLTGLGLDFRPVGLITPKTYWSMAEIGSLAGAGARWDKLNMYTRFDPASFHVGLRPVEAGPGRMRLYVDWKRIE